MSSESHTRTIFTTSQACFTLFFLVLFFILLNGYVLNLVGGYQADPWWVLVGLLLELTVAGLAARSWFTIRFEPLELAGFVTVVMGVWLYFVAASLPTLLPPTQSIDAARHYLQVLFSYPRGTLVSWYPAGGAFVAATLSHWIGWSPLRVLHPTAASFVGLSAGAIYGVTCALLPPRALSKIVALVAPVLLFVPWSYFAGIINWEQYFYSQVFAQYFVVAAMWFIATFATQPRGTWLVLLGMALLGIVAAYPYLVALPVALFILMTFARLYGGNWLSTQNRTVLFSAFIFGALLVLAAAALQQGGILELKSLRTATVSDVGEGGVATPSVENLGGPLFLLLALAGIPIAWRTGAQGRTILGFLVAWLLQLAALTLVQPFFQISGYRVDKTFYILVFPLAILGALVPARVVARWGDRLESHRLLPPGVFILVVVCAVIGIQIWRPARSFSPLAESELETALWVKENLDTYQVSYLDPAPVRSYWLAFGLWRETLPNEWFQWIPAGAKLGPRSLDEWMSDPAWPQWILVRHSDLGGRPVSSLPSQLVYQNGESAVLKKEAPLQTVPTPAVITPWYFSSFIRLLGYDLPKTVYAPGDALSFTTYTESLSPPLATVGWRVELVDRHGSVVSKALGDPFANKYPLQRWPPGRYARDVWTLPLDAGITPGVYSLQMGLYRRTDGEFTVVHSNNSDLAAAPLGTIKIPPVSPGPDELGAATSLQARVGDAFMLAAYDLRPDQLERMVHLTLYWQSLAATENDYTVFVHLQDSSGKLVAQKDAPPLDGNFPTFAWDAGEIIREQYDLQVPPEAAWPTTLEIGMYSQPDLKRLRVGTDDHITLIVK